MAKLTLFIAVISLVVALVSSSKKCKEEDNDNDAMKRFVYANTALTGRYLYQLMLNYPKQSYTIVTLPVCCFVGHLALVAKNDTCEYGRMLKLLGLRNKAEIKNVLAKAVSAINNESDTKSKLTCKVFGDISKKFTTNYIQDFIDICNGEAGYLDYDCPEKALEDVFRWFENQSTTYAAIPLDDTKIFSESDKNAVVYANYMDFVTSFDHEANPNGLRNIDFEVGKNNFVIFPSLYGNGFLKYGKLDDLDCQVIIMYLKGGKHFGVFYYPNNPDNLWELMKKIQDPKVYYGGIERAQWMCLKIHITIGRAEVSNNLFEFVPELCLNETNFQNVFQCGDLAHVNYGFQELHLIADREVRKGQLNSKLCPGDDLPFVKMNHACAYYVMSENGMIVYSGVLLGPQNYAQ